MKIFDLEGIERGLRNQDAYIREGHTARTVVREDDVRVVLIVMKAGSRIAEHSANETATVHTISGHVRLRLADETADLPAGQLLMIEAKRQHDVEAVVDSALLLTLGWRGTQHDD